MKQDVTYDAPTNTESELYTLRFSEDEYDTMLEDIQKGDYTLFVDIVNRILSAKFSKWVSRPLIRMYGLEEDLHSEVIMCLIKEARHIINKDGCAVDPHYFQARVFIVAKGRALNFMDREGYARGVLAGKRFDRLRKELGMEDDAGEGDYDETIASKRTYIPMISVEAGGYSEDGEENAFELPYSESGFAQIETTDEYEDLIGRMNDAAASSNISAHKVIAWFLYITSLRYSWYNSAVTKAWMERMFSEKTLYELLGHLTRHRAIVYEARVTDEQLALLKARLDKPAKNGICVGETRFGRYCMEGKTMRATISDWINRWNTWFRENGIV